MNSRVQCTLDAYVVWQSIKMHNMCNILWSESSYCTLRYEYGERDIEEYKSIKDKQ